MSYDRYAKTSYPGAFGSTYIVAGAAMKTNDYAAARGDLFGAELASFMKRAARGITRITMFGEDQPQAENRVELASDKDEFGMPLGSPDPQFRRRCDRAVERQFRPGHEDRQSDQCQGSWPGKGPVMPTSHLHGGAIMGTGAEQFRDQQFRPEPRNSELVDGRALHLPERGRVEPDLHHLCGVAARGGAPGADVGERRGVASFRSLATRLRSRCELQRV